MIGKIQRLNLREVWKHEGNFTTWLEENIDILNEVADLNLTAAEREKAAGAFSVDLVAEDDDGNLVVVENQMEKSDHDHLGKVITYLTAIDAKAAIWIVADPRPEHVTAITWLNESRLAAFYLLKLESIQIGESPAAPLLTLIVGPSEEGHEVGDTKKKLAERHVLRRKFWTTLLGRAKTKTKLHAGLSPTDYSWIGTGAGKGGLAYNYVITQHESKVELYIDRGKDSEEESKAIFDTLAKHSQEIEKVFGVPLSWERLEGKRACRIAKHITLGGYRDDETKWPEIQDAMIDAMVRLENALRPFVAKLKAGG